MKIHNKDSHKMFQEENDDIFSKANNLQKEFEKFNQQKINLVVDLFEE